MLIEKLLELPSVIYLKGDIYPLQLQIFKNGSEDIRMVYESPVGHIIDIPWYSPFKMTTFIFLVENISTDALFLQAIAYIKLELKDKEQYFEPF